jgi:hypothetical protein
MAVKNVKLYYGLFTRIFGIYCHYVFWLCGPKNAKSLGKPRGRPGENASQHQTWASAGAKAGFFKKFALHLRR